MFFFFKNNELQRRKKGIKDIKKENAKRKNCG